MGSTTGERRILYSALEPPNTNWLWLKEVNGLPVLHQYLSGKWVPFFANNSKQEVEIDIDAFPVAGSKNAVSSGGVYAALLGKVGGIRVNNGNVQYPVNGIVSLTINAGSGDVTGIKVGNVTYVPSTGSTVVDITNAIPDVSGFVLSSSLANVATSGSYDDLINKPTIPSKVSELTNDAGYTNNTGTVTGISVNGGATQSPTDGVVSLTIGTGGPNDIVDVTTTQQGTIIFTKRSGDTVTVDLNHVHPQYVESTSLATVATTGSYEDLTNKPTIPSLSGYVKFWTGTQAEYDALAPNYDSDTLYLIPETTA